MQLRAIEVVMTETSLLLHDRRDGRGVGVDQALDVIASAVHRAVQCEAGGVAIIFRRL